MNHSIPRATSNRIRFMDAHPFSPMATHAFDTGLPSIRQVQNLIRDQQAVEVKLMTGDTLAGSVSWQDVNAICIKEDDNSTILMRGAIAYIKAAG